MKFIISGGTGFIGSRLAERLQTRGEVVVLSRDPSKVRAGRGVAWDSVAPGAAWCGELADADAVINLAGESIGEGRWTDERKKQLAGSRLTATSALVEAMRVLPRERRVFVSASAVGYFGARGDELLDESAAPGSDFLAELTRRWEAAAHEAERFARLVILRFGIVLARDGGALAKMLLPFRLFAGGPVGSGEQWMSWIDRGDALRIIEWAIDTPAASGTYNATAPQPVRNRDFARALGRALHRPAFMPAPGFALRAMFGGEMADALLLSGQRVIPARLEREAFRFEHPSLESSLRDLF